MDPDSIGGRPPATSGGVAPQPATPPPLAPPPPLVGRGPAPVLPYAGGPPPGGYMLPPPQRPPDTPTIRRLLLWSRILGWGGLAFMFVAVCAGAVTETKEIIVAGPVLGILAAVVGAVLGQVGRGMQGRVV